MSYYLYVLDHGEIARKKEDDTLAFCITYDNELYVEILVYYIHFIILQHSFSCS